MTIPISAIVLTKIEEANLPDCLAALAWADKVMVLDSFSTDATVAAAQPRRARYRVVRPAAHHDCAGSPPRRRTTS